MTEKRLSAASLSRNGWGFDQKWAWSNFFARATRIFHSSASLYWSNFPRHCNVVLWERQRLNVIIPCISTLSCSYTILYVHMAQLIHIVPLFVIEASTSTSESISGIHLCDWCIRWSVDRSYTHTLYWWTFIIIYTLFHSSASLYWSNFLRHCVGNISSFHRHRSVHWASQQVSLIVFKIVTTSIDVHDLKCKQTYTNPAAGWTAKLCLLVPSPKSPPGAPVSSKNGDPHNGGPGVTVYFIPPIFFIPRDNLS